MLPGRNKYRPNHGNRLARIMGLKSYISNKEGTLFFGCYNNEEYKSILNHKGPRVLYWGGSDILYMKKNKFKFPKDLVHVVGCKRNRWELKKYGIDALVRPVCELSPGMFKLEPLGKDVYCYIPRKRSAFYGLGIIN